MGTADTAQTVRRRRIQQGLSQIQAAELAGISRQTWGEIERGTKAGSEATLHKVERVLDLPDGSLVALDYRIDDPELVTMRRELVDMVNTLTSRDELEAVRLDITRRRLAALQAELTRLEQAANERTDPDPDPAR
jgi:transcriptional regulator with XRE-family HTH domain